MTQENDNNLSRPPYNYSTDIPINIDDTIIDIPQNVNDFTIMIFYQILTQI